MSLFVSFEGGEGCGKSTQVRILHNRLTRAGYAATMVHEPGGTALGERIRTILKHKIQVQVSPLSEVILFNVSRSQLVAEVIKPVLDAGGIIISDRFADSTIAYQSYGRGIDLAVVTRLNHIAAQGVQPDITFLLDIVPEVGLERKRQKANDRFEKENLEFHIRVRQGFLELATRDPVRWQVIDATLPRADIGDLIWAQVLRMIE